MQGCGSVLATQNLHLLPIVAAALQKSRPGAHPGAAAHPGARGQAEHETAMKLLGLQVSTDDTTLDYDWLPSHATHPGVVMIPPTPPAISFDTPWSVVVRNHKGSLPSRMTHPVILPMPRPGVLS